MIESYAVSNFRSFQDSGTMPLGRITCLVGPNSSGKSSVIHSLMLLKQSLEERPFGASMPQLTLNGSLIQLGSYSDVVHQHRKAARIGFAFVISSAEGDDAPLRTRTI